MSKTNYVGQNVVSGGSTVNNNGSNRVPGNVTLSADDLIRAKAEKDKRESQGVVNEGPDSPSKSFTKEELAAFAESVAIKAAEKTREELGGQIEELSQALQKQSDQPAPVVEPVADVDNGGTSTEQDGESASDWKAKAVELQAQLDKESQEKSKILEQLNKISEDVRRLEGVSSLYGVSNQEGVDPAQQGKAASETQFNGAPYFNNLTNPLQGAVGDVKLFVELLQSATCHEVVNPANGNVAFQRDVREMNNLIARTHREQTANGTPWHQTKLYSEVEKSLKNEGLLRGPTVRNAAGPTIGTPGSVGVLYLDILAQWMRETHNSQNIWWQFVLQVYNPSTAPSLTMGIPRWEFLDEADDINDYLLATTSTYTASQLSVGTGTDSQSLTANVVPIAIAEWGMGKNTGIETRPVFIPEFHQATSLFPLMTAVNTRLMQSYYKFENKKIRLEYEKSTAIYYNDGGIATQDPSLVAVNDDGTMTQAYVNSIYTEMYAAKIPTLPDGRYVATLNPFAANQYKNSLEKLYAPVTEAQRQEISNVLGAATGVEIGHVNSYFGAYNNFHIFIGNDFGVGAPGSIPTRNNAVLGAGTVDTADSFFFGPGCVGRGVALPAEIRASGTNPFGRGESYIWLSREETAPIDLDVTLDANQQTRCVRGRTTMRPV